MIRLIFFVSSFVGDYQKYFSPVVFSQLMGSSLVIGLCCFQFSKVNNEFGVNV
jgi:hypothetical protein